MGEQFKKVLFHIVIPLVILLFGVKPQDDERQLRCPENSTLDTSFILEWPSTLAGNSAESFPLCFNSAYSPITRICWDNGTWEDSEVLEKCSYYQSKRVSVCEDGFENFASLNEPINCVFISKFKERWSDKCSQLGVTESVSQMQSRLRSLRSFLLQKSISSIWYPVMEIKNMSNNQIIGSKCLKLDLKEDDKQLVDANCDEMHHVLCLDYNIDDFLNHTIVPQSIKFEFKSKYYTMNRFLNEQSNLSSSDGVYNMNENSLDFTKAILKKFDITDNDVCVVNIKPIMHDKRFSTINKNGKWTVSDTFNCVIYVTTNSSALIIENTNVQTLFGNTTKVFDRFKIPYIPANSSDLNYSEEYQGSGNRSYDQEDEQIPKDWLMKIQPGCPPDTVNITSLQSFTSLSYPATKINESAAPAELCILRNGLPAIRKCLTSLDLNGTWENLDFQKINCVNQKRLSGSTKNLHAYSLNATKYTDVVENVISITSESKDLIPVDVFYISKIFKNLAETSSSDLHRNYNITVILNNIMSMNKTYVRMSSRSLNATNSILDSFDIMLDQLITNYTMKSDNDIEQKFINDSNQFYKVFVDDDSTILVTNKTIVFTCDPSIQNVSGIVLLRNNSNESRAESFFDYKIKKIYSNQTIKQILDEFKDNIEIGSFLPQSLIQDILEKSKNPLKIVMKTFYSDVLFQENKNESTAKSQSKVMSVSLPGQDHHLSESVPIFFKKANKSSSNEKSCSYWEFKPDMSLYSEWSQKGCNYLNTSKYDEALVICGCDHLTHFTYLIRDSYPENIDYDSLVVIYDVNERVLDIITLIGGCLSIIGILGMFLTAGYSKTWRQKDGTKILLQLSLAIGIQMILILFVNNVQHKVSDEKVNNCVLLGAISHYFLLTTFFWMLITAYLQFKRYVIVLGNLTPEKFMLKASLIGWGVPLIPVSILMLADPSSYIPTYGICYPHGIGLYVAVYLPIVLIITANITVFGLVLFNIFKLSSVRNHSSCDRSLLISQLRVSIFLFFLLGLTWVFGLLAGLHVTFSYLFCITATTQGFVFFVYNVILNPTIKKFWQNEDASRTSH